MKLTNYGPGDWRFSNGKSHYKILRIQNEMQKSNHYWVIDEYVNGLIVANPSLRGSFSSKKDAKEALAKYLNL